MVFDIVHSNIKQENCHYKWSYDQMC